jgi:hypothetical protein
MPIDEFVRKQAPGVLQEIAAVSDANPQVEATLAEPQSSAPLPAPTSMALPVVPPRPDPRERGRRYPKIRVKPAVKPATN